MQRESTNRAYLGGEFGSTFVPHKAGLDAQFVEQMIRWTRDVFLSTKQDRVFEIKYHQFIVRCHEKPDNLPPWLTDLAHEHVSNYKSLHSMRKLAGFRENQTEDWDLFISAYYMDTIIGLQTLECNALLLCLHELSQKISEEHAIELQTIMGMRMPEPPLIYDNIFAWKYSEYFREWIARHPDALEIWKGQ